LSRTCISRHKEHAFRKLGATTLVDAMWAMGWVRLP